MTLYNCIKCGNEEKMTDMIPVWNLLDIQYPKFICKKCQPERSKREDPHINIDEIENLSVENMKIRMKEMEDIILRQYILLSSTKIVEKCLGCGALNTMET